MVARAYVPEAGDLVWIDPQPGHKRRGRRPALILSPQPYNSRSRLAIACPITGQIKGYPFEVMLPPSGTISGAVLSDQVKSLDWGVRRIAFEAKAPESVITEVLERLRVLLGL